MTQSNPSIIACTPASLVACGASDMLGNLQSLPSRVTEPGWDLSALSRSAVDAARRATLELGYGCVDWYIYVSDGAPRGSLPQVAIAE